MSTRLRVVRHSAVVRGCLRVLAHYLTMPRISTYFAQISSLTCPLSLFSTAL